MIEFLLDSSALWRLLRDKTLATGLEELVSAGAVGSCAPQRTEFTRSARSLEEYLQVTEMFGDLYPDVAVPKAAWRWIESAQHTLVRAGALRALSLPDLLVCATAALSGLVVLHDDSDFVTAARYLTDVEEQRVREL
ncbi:PIN domain-containing protein [Nocardioides speluncae]|uniref:PIN domain-containing protein n=1 Tax=Nocardioides speluncae TaxID=2670337 RepID=UPI000D69B59F|nr:PIN domain-containing protein [Nocardioides speluncae]